ncbi:DUF4249 domain-containing protein [Pontibacter qinzhouensis]|uniref:DUF4249 domain-containing protein n=1 Tax=Pontibacter qinzhouensis TaxID=2603253 RepID=A0A5C8KD92_9BACT|nr:DUF4249 domain-containing protein [Pontibacter qinzhouensis]TXK51574.1 DUF4249 domain-containing protein [Pontibacter qinzhouensis]
MKLYQMRYLLLLLAAALLTQFLTACERVVDIDLNTTSPRYVIEGYLTNGENPGQVTITRTKNFSDNNVFEGISNAVVTISDNAGTTETLTQQSPGIYTVSSLAGVPGRSYHMVVTIGDETFSAVSTMPTPVPFDSLYVEEVTTFGDGRLVPYALFNDPAEEDNFYRYELYINNQKVNNIFISRDQYNNGRTVRRSLPRFGDDEDDIKPGDNILVEMQSIERPVYDYFYSLNQTIGQNAAAPGNPVTNITGGALGYFSAHTVQRRNVVVE